MPRARAAHAQAKGISVRRTVLAAGLFLVPCFVLALSGAHACGGHPVPEPSPSEGGTDAALDASPPVVPDNSDQYDAGVDPFQGAWDRLPGNPVNCAVKIAEIPASSAPTLTWGSCPNRNGCKRLKITWTSNPFGALMFRDPEPIRLVGGKPFVRVELRWPLDQQFQYTGSTAATMTVVGPMDGVPVFAVGEFLPPPPLTACPYVLGYSDSGIAMQANPLPLYDWTTFAWSTWANPTKLSATVLPHSSVPCNCVGVVFDEQSIACTCAPQPSVILFDTASSQLIMPQMADAMPLEGDPGNPVAPDGFLLSRANGGSYGFDLMTGAGAASPLLWDTPHNIMNVALDRSASNQIVWVEFDGLGPYSSPTLETSPYATGVSGLNPSLVTKFSSATTHPPGYELVANAGMALNLVNDTTALLTRLSDGWSWPISADPGDIFLRPLWVDDTEVWIATGDAASKKMWSIIRLDRASLGAPTIAPVR